MRLALVAIHRGVLDDHVPPIYRRELLCLRPLFSLIPDLSASRRWLCRNFEHMAGEELIGRRKLREQATGLAVEVGKEYLGGGYEEDLTRE